MPLFLSLLNHDLTFASKSVVTFKIGGISGNNILRLILHISLFRCNLEHISTGIMLNSG